jgi:hypothetical protein
MPNENLVKPFLQSSIVIVDSSGYKFIYHEANRYKIKSSQNILMILKSLKQLNLSFSKLFGYLLDLRNILVHNNVVNIELISHLTDSLRYYVYYLQKNYLQEPEEILIPFLNDLIKVCCIILTGNKTLPIEMQQKKMQT